VDDDGGSSLDPSPMADKKFVPREGAVSKEPFNAPRVVLRQ
jgi:hypothetical protein